MSDHAVAGVFIDATGRTRMQVIKALTNPCTILNNVQALSNAAVAYNFDGPIDPQIGTSTAAMYQPAQLYANLLFQTAAGTNINLQIISPKASIFLADNVTVDPSAITALISACIGQLSDGAGNVAITYLGGALAPSRGSYQALGY